MPKFQVVSEYQPAGVSRRMNPPGALFFYSVWTRFCFAKRLDAAGRRRASARGWPPFRFPDL